MTRQQTHRRAADAIDKAMDRPSPIDRAMDQLFDEEGDDE